MPFQILVHYRAPPAYRVSVSHAAAPCPFSSTYAVFLQPGAASVSPASIEDAAALPLQKIIGPHDPRVRQLPGPLRLSRPDPPPLPWSGGYRLGRNFRATSAPASSRQPHHSHPAAPQQPHQRSARTSSALRAVQRSSGPVRGQSSGSSESGGEEERRALRTGSATAGGRRSLCLRLA